MNRSRWTPLLFAIAAVMFFVAGFLPRLDGEKLNTTMVVLGVVFLVLAASHYRRWKAREKPTTDPRLPASKKPDPTTRR